MGDPLAVLLDKGAVVVGTSTGPFEGKLPLAVSPVVGRIGGLFDVVRYDRGNVASLEHEVSINVAACDVDKSLIGSAHVPVNIFEAGSLGKSVSDACECQQ